MASRLFTCVALQQKYNGEDSVGKYKSRLDCWMSFLGFCSGSSSSENHMVHYQVPACFVFALLLKIKPRTAICFMIISSRRKKKIHVKSCLTTYSVITVLTSHHFPYCTVFLSLSVLWFHRVCAWLLLSFSAELLLDFFGVFFCFGFVCLCFVLLLFAGVFLLPLWCYWISRYV